MMPESYDLVKFVHRERQVCGYVGKRTRNLMSVFVPDETGKKRTSIKFYKLSDIDDLYIITDKEELPVREIMYISEGRINEIGGLQT